MKLTQNLGMLLLALWLILTGLMPFVAGLNGLERGLSLLAVLAGLLILLRR
jgi:hypothetical protein